MQMQTIFEPHPVSPERKAELRAQGFKIIDARFAPPGVEDEPQEVISVIVGDMKQNRKPITAEVAASTVRKPRAR
jgi:hypothetical protein